MADRGCWALLRARISRENPPVKRALLRNDTCCLAVPIWFPDESKSSSSDRAIGDEGPFDTSDFGISIDVLLREVRTVCEIAVGESVSEHRKHLVGSMEVGMVVSPIVEPLGERATFRLCGPLPVMPLELGVEPSARRFVESFPPEVVEDDTSTIGHETVHCGDGC